MVWARDKIGRPNESDITGNGSKAVEEGAGRKRAGSTTSRTGPANPLLILKPWHTAGRSGEN